MLPLNFENLVSRRFGPLLPDGHAGVGVVSMHGAPLSLPTLATPAFAGFYGLGRALRVVLSLGSGWVAHLFVVYGYQGAESDPDKPALTDQLINSVLCNAKVCCWSVYHFGW